MSLAHGTATWIEPAGSGAFARSTPLGIVFDGTDYGFSSTTPETHAFFLIGSDYILCSLTLVSGHYHDTGGTIQSITPGTTPRMRYVQIGSNIQGYAAPN